MIQKLMRTFFSVLFIGLFLLCGPFSFYAHAQSADVSIDPAVMETIEISDSKKAEYIDDFALNSIDGSLDDFKQYSIITFDVSEDEHIAIGLDNDTVLICDKEMHLLRVLQFKSEGKYYLDWNGNTLDLIFYRSYLTFSIDANNTVTSIAMYDSFESETNRILRPITRRTTTVKNHTVYSIEKSTWTMKYLGGDRYDMLTRTDAHGNKEILFDSEVKSPNDVIIGVSIWIVGMLIFATIVLSHTFVFIAIRRKVAQRKTGDGSLP